MRDGRRRRAGCLVVMSAPGSPGETRLGLVVGKRVGGAVERNRVKRRLRHAARQADLVAGRDVVVVASREALDADFGDLVRWLERGCEVEDNGGE